MSAGFDRLVLMPQHIPRQLSRKFFIVISLFLAVLFFIVLFASASLKDHVTFRQSLGTFAQQFYLPQKNGIFVGTFLGHNVLLYFYGLFGLLTLAALVVLFWERGRIERERLKALILVAAVITFLSLGIFQGVHHVKTFAGEFKKFHGTTQEQRIASYFKNSYAYARYCQKHVPGKHWGRVVTGTNIKEAEAMLTFFAVAYYLYPIDIRIDVQHPPDCLVIFLKKNPLESVPADYRAFEPYDERSLIAIRKDAEHASHY